MQCAQLLPIGGALRFTPLPRLLFRHPRSHLAWGGCHHPQLVCPLIEIELRNKNKRKFRDLLNLTISDFTTIDYFNLHRAGQTKICCSWRKSTFLQITFEPIRIKKTPKHHRIPPVKTHRNICILTPKAQCKILTLPPQRWGLRPNAPRWRR